MKNRYWFVNVTVHTRQGAKFANLGVVSKGFLEIENIKKGALEATDTVRGEVNVLNFQEMTKQEYSTFWGLE